MASGRVVPKDRLHRHQSAHGAGLGGPVLQQARHSRMSTQIQTMLPSNGREVRECQITFMVLARLLCFLGAFTVGTPSMAQITSSISAGLVPPKVGRVTNLPMPRYVSLKAKKANVRRGPGLTYRIDWIFQRRNMPVQITAEYGNWRRVIDRNGEGGWIHYVMLSGVRTVIVNKDSLSLRTKPASTAPVRAVLEQNVIAWLGDCQGTWCELTAGGYTGWAHKVAIWGVSLDGPEFEKE